MKNNITFILCGRGYCDKDFDKICKHLENGETVRIGIDCIGHSMNNAAQEDFKSALLEKYGDRLDIVKIEGVCRYGYVYELR